MVRAIVKRRPLFGPALLVLSLAALAGCEEGQGPAFLQPKDKTETGATTSRGSSEAIERDVEAPEVFEASEAGLWDGRPSLGGVWVAHPDATDPERVVITNTANGKSVVGALFRRERDIPGPRLQVSSDAAETLGMLAGAPVELSVIALRKEVVEPEPVVEEDITEAETVEVTEEITATELDPIAGAAAAIDAAPETAAAAAPAANPGASYVQIGIFSVEANANRAANQMRSAGMTPSVLEENASDKTFWRVVVGPADTKSERTALLNKVKKTGFSDAYIVTR
ncbi:SPOR domain-containing protein [Ruegeria sp. 2205SS24-7]|uniref:SPOR domain-containing protein n=1 Tax=Ruegeria discodermiae TaxID=3064389 RepID=UPI002742728C|nr:SPOR domain-containing protein [Ruegeria sp. 2205SS24-7]MDP5215682.1 SPOR domain-containing protein [Ruegeria sp. 2205SS24-7]